MKNLNYNELNQISGGNWAEDLIDAVADGICAVNEFYCDFSESMNEWDAGYAGGNICGFGA